MTSNMDYGLFGIQMEINNLRDTIRKIRKILCGQTGMPTSKNVRLVSISIIKKMESGYICLKMEIKFLMDILIKVKK